MEITSFINSDTVIIDYNSEADEYGNYSLELQLLSYGPINFSLDAAIDEVIAPNSLKRYGRFNPSTSAPIVVIQNRGADTLSNLVITYGPEGSSKVYNWTGKLGFMDKEEVKLEAFNWSEWVSGDGRFQAVVSQPNGAADENPINDHYSSRYEDASVYPSTIVIKFKTNKVAYQNRYEIRTNDGELVFEKDDFENQTVYSDTITLLGGCYDFRMFDSGDNGISFWANSEGSGYLKFYDIEGNLLESFGGDFGDQIYKSFFADVHIGFEDKAKGILSFDVIPNPNDGRFHLSYALNEADNYNIQIINSQGQTVWESKQNLIKTGKIEIQLEKEAAGVYSCVFTNQKVSLSKKFIISR